MMPLAINFSLESGVGVPLMVGTVWAGGAVAVISPLAAQMAETTFGDHLTTSFPYLIAGVITTALGYIAVGLLV